MFTRHMRRALSLALAVVFASASLAHFTAAAATQAQPQTASVPAVPPQAYFSDPAISPDRSEIAFVSGGDIWTVAASGGEARLLVSHSANEYRPVYSPDGRRLAFGSTRTGAGDIYVLTFETGDLQRLTFDDAFEQLDSWSHDGRWLYFSATVRDIGGMNDIYRVSPTGGTPMQVSADRYFNEFAASASPDGQHLAFVARGFAQWWRRGNSHMDESEIWLMRGHSTAQYERLTEGGAREQWPMWSDDGRSIFYVSDKGGAPNVWTRPVGSQPQQARQLTKFRDGRVLWPSISADGRAIVFERDFRIWRLDTSSGQATEVAITRRGVPSGPSVERLRLTEQFQELALAPDGKKVAFVVRGEVFAASATDGGDAVRVTTTHAPESQLTWSPDSRRLVYVSTRNGHGQLFQYEFGPNIETQLTAAATADSAPRFSPDGRLLAYERDAAELRVMTFETKQERVVARGHFERPPLNSDRPFVWSPDSRWIAYMPVGAKQFKNVHLVPVDASRPAAPVSFLANLNSNTVSWSPDGTFILFDTGQRTEDNQLVRIDLIPRTPRFREDQFRELFREETPRSPAPNLRVQQETQPTPTPTPAALPTPTPSPSPAASPSPEDAKRPATKTTEIVFDGIRRRVGIVPVGVDVGYQTISPDGKYVLMIASAANQQQLYVYPLDELSREPTVARQLTSTQGFKSFAQFTPDSKEVFYLEQGRIQVAPLDQRQQGRTLAVTAEFEVDFAREKMEVFNQAWTYLRDWFYDPKFHGVDWSAMRTAYAPRVAGARTPDEMRRILQLMVGELNASHSGVSAPGGGAQPTTGRLGLRFDRAEYETTGRLRITEVVPLGPAALARDASTADRARELKPGDYLLAVDGRPLDARTNLDELLNYKINRRTVLTVAQSADGGGRREVAVRPVNAATERGLLYRKWVDDKRAYVARVSGGRLGYVHMFDMSAASLAQLYLDLDAENHAREGVVIDIRNNNGGFVNVYAIDVLSRRSYITMTPRGFPTGPARTTLGQRAIELPTVLVTNQHSLSDAEDFAEGYRALKLGKIVGEPTAGWIIYTSNVPLVDGSVVRLPFVKIETASGENMELSPRPVDVPVTRPAGESYTDRDVQLDTAVRELLGQRRQ